MITDEEKANMREILSEPESPKSGQVKVWDGSKWTWGNGIALPPAEWSDPPPRYSALEVERLRERVKELEDEKVRELAKGDRVVEDLARKRDECDRLEKALTAARTVVLGHEQVLTENAGIIARQRRDIERLTRELRGKR